MTSALLAQVIIKAIVTDPSIADRAAAVAACKVTLNGLSTLTAAAVTAAAWGRGLGLARSSPAVLVVVNVVVVSGNAATSSNGDRE